MHHYVAFLRGINLGNRRIKMTDLRALFEEMKFSQVETFIASGNVIFSSKESDETQLTRRIEHHLHAKLGYTVDTFVRTRIEVATVVAFQPFSGADLLDPANSIYCSFLREPLGAAQARGLLACRTDVDEFRVGSREFYWLCRIKSSESKVWASPQMRALKLPSSSMRNFTTIRKLAAQFPVGATA